MQIALENLTGLERKLSITIPSEQVEKEILSRLQKFAAKAKIPGFRPGKVPFAILQKQYGASAREDVVNNLIQESYRDALKQEKLMPASFPQIDLTNVKPNEPLTFTAIFEVYPEIKLADLSNIEATKIVSEVGDNDVVEMLEKLRREHVEWKEITDPKRGAQKDDQLTVDFTVSVHSVGKPPAPKTEKDVKFVLGSGFMWPDFETPLYNAKAGDEIKFTLKFPLTHIDKELVGKHADFVVKVLKVCEPIYPELDDAFAKKLHIKDGTFANLHQEVHTNMDRELQQTLKGLYKAAVLEKLYELNPIEVPKTLVAQELKSMQERFEQSYAHATNKPEFPRASYEDRAKRFVTLGLLLAAVIKENSIKVEPQELKAKVEEMASIYDDAAKVVNWYYSNKDRMLEVESTLLEEKAVDFLGKQMKVIEKPIRYKDVMEKSGRGK